MCSGFMGDTFGGSLTEPRSKMQFETSKEIIEFF